MADVTEYKCPSCGASLRFDINSQRMVCDSCSSSFDLEYIRSHFNEVTDAKLADFDWIERTKYVWEPDMLEQLVEFSCSSCGGNIITKNTSASARCPFCNHEVVISSNFSGDIRPDKVIPFKRKAEEFAEKYREEIASAAFAPKEFSDPAVTDNIVGCYIPIWLYSCSCDCKTNNYSAKYKVTDYPILGTDIKKEAFYSVASFLYDEAEDFTESCLTGFYASRYTIGAEHVLDIVEKEVRSACSARAAILAEGDYIPDAQKAETSLSDLKLMYYLVPVWFLNVTYKGNDYTFAMNGQTGEFASPKVPFNSKSKLHFWSIFLVCEIIAFLLTYCMVKDNDMNALTALFLTFMVTIFMSTIPAFIAAVIIHLVHSKKYIGGLRSDKPYKVQSVSSFINEYVGLNRMNRK